MRKYFLVPLFLGLTILTLSVAETSAQERRRGQTRSELSRRSLMKRQRLIFSDEFNDSRIDTSKWDTIPRGSSHWNRYMSYDPSLIYFEDGALVLEGRVNSDTTYGAPRYLTGGLWSQGKFSFKNGRIDIRAKLGEARGAWPAFWLLPDNENRKWPDSGEIDIMEHLNHDEFVYQTTHTNYTYNLKISDNPYNSGIAKIRRGEYNIYSLAWNDNVIQWFVNGKPTFSYPRFRTKEADNKGQWPYEDPFFILFSQQLGGVGTWVGEISDEDLPVKMWIDWVRVYKWE